MPKDKEVDNAPMNEDVKDPSSAKEAKQRLKAEEKQARKEHSKSGANTHHGQGMEYVPRKTHYADVPHNY